MPHQSPQTVRPHQPPAPDQQLARMSLAQLLYFILASPAGRSQQSA